MGISAFLRASVAGALVAINTVVLCSLLFVVALFKAMLPLPSIRLRINRLLVLIADTWIAGNGAVFALMTRMHWRVHGLEGLRPDRSYLVICNHQSWVDIPVLQRVLTRRIPFLRFFLKQQLIWVPLLGLAWWALDFPFMKRYTREQLERRPELRGTDMIATRKACERFRALPVSVMNFPEGTRFTPAKHARQGAAFAHLLKPKAGGLAFVLEAMGDSLHGIVDVTLIYPQGRPTLVDLLAGRVGEVELHVKERPIEAWMGAGSYEQDAEHRARIQAWVQQLWLDKDALIARRVGAIAATGD